jgi:hypothetical protein
VKAIGFHQVLDDPARRLISSGHEAESEKNGRPDYAYAVIADYQCAVRSTA